MGQNLIQGTTVPPSDPSSEAAHPNPQELLIAAFDHAPGGMCVAGLDGRYLLINRSYSALLGFSPDELIGRNFAEFTHPDDVAEDQEFMAAAAAGEIDVLDREKRYLRRDGSIAWMGVHVEVIRDKAGEPLYFISHLEDISRRRSAREKLRDSERTLRSVIDNTPARVGVKGRDFRYQLVNREFEDAFDVRSEEMIGRSDEDILPAAAVEAVRAKDRLVLEGGQTMQDEETFSRDGREYVFLTVRFPLFDENGEIHAVCVMSTDVTDRRLQERASHERLRCSERIHSALAQDRLVLHGQSIVNLATMEVEQTELLLRMFEADGGNELVGPREFLPAAERFDLIGVIDEWVVERAVEFAADGHRVEVNLSAKTISHPAKVERIERAIVASRAPPENLIFEVTETAVAENLEAARTFALRLRELGCAFALDDFGIGHGTFTYLKHLPVDYLKIDLQFVRDLLTNATDRQVVQAIIGVAREFGIKTIAEGVEDQATLDELRRIGADYAQGYWIDRPMPLTQLWTSPNASGDAHVIEQQ